MPKPVFTLSMTPRHGLRAAVLAAGCLHLASTHAARPMNTDDARIVDAKACQLETWVRKNRDSTEFWALPACNPTGEFELTVGGTRTTDKTQDHSAALQMQLKTLFKPLEPNGWGVGLALGTFRNNGPVGGYEPYLYVPMSWSLRQDDSVVLHTNLGWLRDHQVRKHHLTWGAASEVQVSPRTWLIGEVFGQNTGKPSYQVALRYWIVPNRVQVDTTYGNRFGSGSGDRWFSVGLRLLSPPFLP